MLTVLQGNNQTSRKIDTCKLRNMSWQSYLDWEAQIQVSNKWRNWKGANSDRFKY